MTKEVSDNKNKNIEVCYTCNKEFEMNEDGENHYHYGKYPMCDYCSEFYGFYDKNKNKKSRMKIDKDEVKKLKGEGFLLQNDREHFAVRIVSPAGKFSSEKVQKIIELSEKYGTGEICLTLRTCIELPGIDYENIPIVKKELKDINLDYGGTGNRVRPIVACKGTYCLKGTLDTQKLAKELYDSFYPMKTPAKLKINIVGCPNNCSKVQIYDIGIKKTKNGVNFYLGGKYGRLLIVGEKVEKVIPTEEIKSSVSKIIDWYNQHGEGGDRLGETIRKIKEKDPSFTINQILE